MIKSNKNVLKALLTSIALMMGVMVVNGGNNPSIQVEAATTTESYNFLSLSTFDYTKDKAITLSNTNWTASIAQYNGGVFYLGCNSKSASQAALDSANWANEITAIQGVTGTPYTSSKHTYLLKLSTPQSNVSEVKMSWAGGNSVGKAYLVQDNGNGYVTSTDSYVSTDVANGTTAAGSLTLINTSPKTMSNLLFIFVPNSNSKTLRITTCDITTAELPSVTYNATLHYNDNVTENGTISSSLETGLFAKPEDPVRDGYLFDGWYTEETFENVFDFNMLATANIDLYAKWVDESDFYLSMPTVQLGVSYEYTSASGSDAILTSVDQIVDGEYIIASNVNGEYTTALDTLGSNSISINKNTRTSEDVYGQNEVKFTFTKEADGNYSIKNAAGKYLQYTSGKQEIAYVDTLSDTCKWVIIENTLANAPGTFNIHYANDATYILGHNKYNGRSDFSVCRQSYSNWYCLELIDANFVGDATFSNYMLRYETSIATANYAKMGTVTSYGVLIVPTAKLEGLTFKELVIDYGIDGCVELSEAVNIKDSVMQTNETMYSFAGVLQNIPATELKTSISTVCYVENSDGKIYLSEQRDISVAEVVDAYIRQATELELSNFTLNALYRLRNSIA